MSSSVAQRQKLFFNCGNILVWQYLITTPLSNSLCKDLFYETTWIPDNGILCARKSRQSHEHHITMFHLQKRYPDIIWYKCVLMCQSPPVWCFIQDQVNSETICCLCTFLPFCLSLLPASEQLLAVNCYIRCVIFPGFVCLLSQQGSSPKHTLDKTQAQTHLAW